MQKILIVDDDRAVADTLSEILRRDGYTVDTEYESETALDRISALEYAVVVTDLRLGDDDGNDILCHLRDNAPCTIGILFSAYPSRVTVLRARNCAAYAFLLKPCDPDLFKQTVSRAVELHREWVTLRDNSYLES